MAAKANSFGRLFLTCFMIGFVKLQLFIVALYAFDALKVDGPGFFMVVAVQALLAAAFAWYDSAILGGIRQRSEQS